MKNILLIITVLFLYGCQTVERVTLPVNSDNKVEYYRQLNYGSLKREQIYDKIIQWIVIKYQDKDIKQRSRTDGTISILGRGNYQYKGNSKIVGYKLVFLIDDETCKIIITDINIRSGKNIELFYDDYNNDGGRNTKLSKAFSYINDAMNDALKQITDNIQ